MNAKKLWLSWLYLYILCAVLGFIPQPTGFAYAVLMALAICFFVPGFLLVYRAERRSDVKTIQQVRLASIVALGVSVLLIVLNMASALLSKAWGDVLYAMLVIFASPLVCGQAWVLTLFGWACLLFYSSFSLRSAK